MSSPPKGAPKPRRRGFLGLVLIAGLAIVAGGVFTALFGFDQLKKHSFVVSEASRALKMQSISLAEGLDGGYQIKETSGWRNPAKPITGAEEMITSGGPRPAGEVLLPKIILPDPASGTIAGAYETPQLNKAPAPIEHLVFNVSYPGAVTIGDSIPIKINVSSQTIDFVRNGNIELTLDSGSLDWGDGRNRTVKEGEEFPVDINFSAGTKATGTSTIIVLAKAPDPFVFVTSAAIESTDGPGADSDAARTKKAAASGQVAALGTAAGPLSAESAIAGAQAIAARLELDTKIDVAVLTKYAIPDTWVHWIGIGGWVVTAIGAGTIFGGVGFLWKRRKQVVPAPIHYPDT